MAKYKLSPYGVIDTETGAFIPEDPRNADWRRYLKWLEEGNEPDPMETLDDVKRRKLAELRGIYRAICSETDEIFLAYKKRQEAGIATSEDAAEYAAALDRYRLATEKWRVLRKAIEQATTVEEVDGITWN